MSVKVDCVLKSFGHFKGLGGRSISSNGRRVSSKLASSARRQKNAPVSNSSIKHTPLAKKIILAKYCPLLLFLN